MKKQLLFLLAFIALLVAAQSPQRFNKVVVAGDITSPKFIRTNSTADSVLLGNGGVKAVNTFASPIDTTIFVRKSGTQTITGVKTFSSGMYANGLQSNGGALFYGQKTPFVTGVGTYVANYVSTTYGARILAYDGNNYQPLYLGKLISGSTFQLGLNSDGSSAFGGNLSASNLSGTNTGDETLTSIKTKLGAASASNSGYLTNTDWSTFNGKQSALTLGNFTSNTSGVTIGNGTGAVVGPGVSLAIATADAAHDGLLSYGHFNAFNNKVSFPGFGMTIGKAWGYDSHPTTIGGYGITDIPTYSGTNFILNQNSSAQPANMWISGIVSSLRCSLGDGVSGVGYVDFKPIANSDSRSWRIRTDLTYNGELSFLVSSDNFNTQSKVFGIEKNGNTTIYTAATSTLPTNGALVVNGGVGADHVRANNFYGNGSNLTGVQLPITLTTNGTSGAATLTDGVLNVPNYGGNIISGSFSGYAYPTTTITVTIGATMPNTTYKVFPAPTNEYTGLVYYDSSYIFNKTTTTFDIHIPTTSKTELITFDWMIIK